MGNTKLGNEQSALARRRGVPGGRSARHCQAGMLFVLPWPCHGLGRSGSVKDVMKRTVSSKWEELIR